MYWIFFLQFACSQENEIITGVPQEPLLEEKQSAEDIREDENRQPMVEEVYSRPEGVDVDVFQLTGKMHKEVQGDLLDQLGDFVSQHRIQQKNGERRIYQRGELRMENNQIYMIKFQLKEPMRRSAALKAAGFPKFVDKYLNSHKEYQLNNEWEFRRIRMKKLEPDSELVTHFEAWKWVPQERVRR